MMNECETDKASIPSCTAILGEMNSWDCGSTPELHEGMVWWFDGRLSVTLLLSSPLIERESAYLSSLQRLALLVRLRGGRCHGQ